MRAFVTLELETNDSLHRLGDVAFWNSMVGSFAKCLHSEVRQDEHPKGEHKFAREDEHAKEEKHKGK